MQNEIGLTGKTRFKAHNKLYGFHQLVLQVEVTMEDNSECTISRTYTRWRDAQVEDLNIGSYTLNENVLVNVIK